jgi:hypothetical protein
MPGSGGGSSASSGGGRGGFSSGSSNSSSGARSANNATIAGEDTAYAKPRGVIDAVEEIQRFYVFESRDKDLPYDFFSFKQVLDFFLIGLRGAMFESVLFFLVFPVALTVYPAAKVYFMGVQPTIGDYILPFVLSYSMIVIMTIYVISAARYYKGGVVTRKAIHSLFAGRSLAFVIKAFLGWWLLTLLYIYSYKDPNLMWSATELISWIWNIFMPRDSAVSSELLYVFYYQAVAPSLRSTADDIFVTMLILAAIPFTTLFTYGGYRFLRKQSAFKRFEKYDSRYDLGGLFSFAKPKPNGIHLAIGYSIDDYRKEKLGDIYQLNQNRSGHTFIVGTTRVGKTRLIQNMITQDILAGRSVGLIDPKGDWEIWQAIVQAAFQAGRQDELIFISPYYPQYSCPINVLHPFLLEEEPINNIVFGIRRSFSSFSKTAVFCHSRVAPAEKRSGTAQGAKESGNPNTA